MSYWSKKLTPGDIEEAVAYIQQKAGPDTKLLFRLKDHNSDGPCVLVVGYPIYKETDKSYMIRWPNNKGYKIIPKSHYHGFAQLDPKLALKLYEQRKIRHLQMLKAQYEDAKQRYLMSIDRGNIPASTPYITEKLDDVDEAEGFTF